MMNKMLSIECLEEIGFVIEKYREQEWENVIAYIAEREEKIKEAEEQL